MFPRNVLRDKLLQKVNIGMCKAHLILYVSPRIAYVFMKYYCAFCRWACVFGPQFSLIFLGLSASDKGIQKKQKGAWHSLQLI